MNMKKIIGYLSAAALTLTTAAFSAMTAFAEDSEAAASVADTAAAPQTGSVFFQLFLPLILIFAFMYFVMIRPQKKRDKELKDMQDSLQIGDEVVTSAGIVGMVVSVGDDTVVIETGGARHKLRIKTWAVSENVTAMERVKAAKTAGTAKKAEKSPIAAAAVADDEDESADKKAKNKPKDKE